MIESETAVVRPNAAVKARKSKYAHLPPEERKALTAANALANFQARHPDYQKEYQAAYRAEKRKGIPTPRCQGCGSEKSKVPSGQWSCFVCRDFYAEEAARRQVEKNLAAERRAVAKQAREDHVLARLVKKAERQQQRDADRARALLEKEILSSRPAKLTDGYMFTGKELEHFWSKVRKTPQCWEWAGSSDASFEWSGEDAPAHRVSWFLHNGALTSETGIRRTCGNSRCILPGHLEAYNIQEDVEKQRKESAAFRAQFKVVTGKNKPMPEISVELEERFWSKVDKTLECWRWTSQSCEDGYGRFQIRGINFPAHRVSYYLHNGKIDQEQQVHHSCDSPFCVNPAHLTQGDGEVNWKDSFHKKRTGHREFLERLWNPTPEQQVEIKLLREAGVKEHVISRKYGVPKVC